MPARSTVDSGSRTAEATKSSRSRAKICSESTKDPRRATQVVAVSASRAAASSPTSTSMSVTAARPVVTVPTTWPMTQGPASPATAATRCQTSTQARARRCSRSSTPTCWRTTGPGAMGRVRRAWSVRSVSGDIYSSSPRTTTAR